MSFPYQCPHCGFSLEVQDEFAGKSGPCVQCGKWITLPWHAPRSPVSAQVAPSASASAPAKAHRGGYSVLITIMLVVGGVSAAVAIFALGTALLLPAVQAGRAAARRSQCHSNLDVIATALLRYHDDQGAFPPAYIPAPDGTPMHSWRVLLLPYLENGQWLYSQYDMSQPWDSPANIALLTQMPEVYGCPEDENVDRLFETSYVLVTGPGTAFPGGGQSTSAGSFLDGTSTTILVVERNGSGVAWLEPGDLDIQGARFQINSSSKDLSSGHPRGVHVATASGDVLFLDESTPPDIVRAMITPSGGEVIPPDYQPR